MKKLFFLIFMVAVTICWAMHPPDHETNLVSEKESLTSHDFQIDQLQLENFKDVGEAQEVAFIYIGDYSALKCYDLSKNDFVFSSGFNGIVKISIIHNMFANSRKLSLQNKINFNRQNSNYGYPLTAN